MTNALTFEQRLVRNVEAEAVRSGLSKKDMSVILGKSLMSIHSRFAGDIEFRPSELNLLANAMGIDITEFFVGTQRKAGA